MLEVIICDRVLYEWSWVYACLRRNQYKAFIVDVHVVSESLDAPLELLVFYFAQAQLQFILLNQALGLGQLMLYQGALPALGTVAHNSRGILLYIYLVLAERFELTPTNKKSQSLRSEFWLTYL